MVSTELSAGDVIVSWTETPTNVDLFLMGVAYWTSHRIHYDETWAKSEGYDGPVVPGVLMYGWIERELVRWAGSPSAIKHYNFRHIGLVCCGEPIHGTISVAEPNSESDPSQVPLTISLTLTDGTAILNGTAVVERA